LDSFPFAVSQHASTTPEPGVNHSVTLQASPSRLTAISFHEKAGLSQAGFVVSVERSSMELLRLCRHPSIRTLCGAILRQIIWSALFPSTLSPWWPRRRTLGRARITAQPAAIHQLDL